MARPLLMAAAPLKNVATTTTLLRDGDMAKIVKIWLEIGLERLLLRLLTSALGSRLDLGGT